MTNGRPADREAIQNLKARYFRLMDTKKWQGWLTLFTSDIVVRCDMAVSTRVADGRTLPASHSVEEFVSSTRAAIEEASSSSTTRSRRESWTARVPALPMRAFSSSRFTPENIERWTWSLFNESFHMLR
jgi:hypothetical protein